MGCEELSSPTLTPAPIRFYHFTSLNFDKHRGQRTKMTWIRVELAFSNDVAEKSKYLKHSSKLCGEYFENSLLNSIL